VVADFAAVMKAYGVTTAEADRWGGDWVKEGFSKHGIRITPSAKTKADIYRELLPMLNATACALIDNARLTSQLCALERRTAHGARWQGLH
jgi:hypothetical protein